MADRRDSKGRKLHTGESQDKSGRYRFSYREGGQQYCLYSWRLTDTDAVPSGKRPCQSLRSQIREYNWAKERGIAFRGNNMTVLKLVEEYLKRHDSKVSRKHSTVVGHSIAVKHLKETKLSR